MNTKERKKRYAIKPSYAPSTLGDVILRFEQKIILKQAGFNQTADVIKQRIAREIQYLRNNWLNRSFDFEVLAKTYGIAEDINKMIHEIIPASDVRIPERQESEIIYQILDDYKASLGTDRYFGKPLSQENIEARHQDLIEVALMVGY